MLKWGLEVCKSATGIHKHWFPHSPACDLLLDSLRLKDTEDGVKEVSWA